MRSTGRCSCRGLAGGISELIARLQSSSSEAAQRAAGESAGSAPEAARFRRRDRTRHLELGPGNPAELDEVLEPPPLHLLSRARKSMDVRVARLGVRPADSHELIDERAADPADVGREMTAILRDVLLVAVRSVDLPVDVLRLLQRVGRWRRSERFSANATFTAAGCSS